MTLPHSPPVVSDKLKSKLEASISIAYVLVVGLLLKGISWFFGEAIDEKFGGNSGAIAAYLIVPLSFLVAALIVAVGSYMAISITYGKDVAEEVIFRWRKPK